MNCNSIFSFSEMYSKKFPGTAVIKQLNFVDENKMSSSNTKEDLNCRSVSCV